jgi:hypothetical protein
LIEPPEGGVREASYVLCHYLVTLSEDKIDAEHCGVMTGFTMLAVEKALKQALDLS